MRQYAKEYRERMIITLSREYREQEPSEILKANEIIAAYRKKQADIEPQLSRLQTSECPDSVCPKCFYLHNLTIQLKDYPSNDNVDKFRCPQCNTIYEENF